MLSLSLYKILYVCHKMITSVIMYTITNTCVLQCYFVVMFILGFTGVIFTQCMTIIMSTCLWADEELQTAKNILKEAKQTTEDQKTQMTQLNAVVEQGHAYSLSYCDLHEIKVPATWEPHSHK